MANRIVFNISESEQLFASSVLTKTPGNQLVIEEKGKRSWFGKIVHWWRHKDSRISQVKNVMQNQAIEKTKEINTQASQVRVNDTDQLSALSKRCKNIAQNLKNFDQQVIRKHNRTRTSFFCCWTKVGSISRAHFEELDKTLKNIIDKANETSKFTPPMKLNACYKDLVLAADALDGYVSTETLLALGQLRSKVQKFAEDKQTEQVSNEDFSTALEIARELQQKPEEKSLASLEMMVFQVIRVINPKHNTTELKKIWAAIWQAPLKDEAVGLPLLSPMDKALLENLKTHKITTARIKEVISLTLLMYEHKVHPEKTCPISLEKLFNLDEVLFVANDKINQFYNKADILAFVEKEGRDPLSEKQLRKKDLKEPHKEVYNLFNRYVRLWNDLGRDMRDLD